MQDPQVYIGQPVEVTQEDVDELAHEAGRMFKAVASHEPGWLHEFFRAHQRAHRKLRELVRRSQRNARLESDN